MSIKIDRIENGFLIIDNDGETARQYCVEESEDVFERDEAETVQNLLYLVKDMLGITESRYNSKRVYIEIKHGDKCDCFDPECEICKDEFESARASLEWEQEREKEIKRRKIGEKE